MLGKAYYSINRTGGSFGVANIPSVDRSGKYQSFSIGFDPNKDAAVLEGVRNCFKLALLAKTSPDMKLEIGGSSAKIDLTKGTLDPSIFFYCNLE